MPSKKLSPKTSSAPCRILFIGTGLINTSFALAISAIKHSSPSPFHLIGWDINPETLAMAKSRGAFLDIASSLESALASIDIAIIGVPINAYDSIFKCIENHAQPSTIISDVGSVKGSVVKLARALMPSHFNRFVPAHPIAGLEKSGPLSANTSLFQQQQIILTPNRHTDPLAILSIEKLWQAVGGQTSIMKAKAHDEVCAAISHVPHLLSMAMVLDLMLSSRKKAKDIDGEKALSYAGGGFRDFSRIAGSHPTMWHDIFLNNPTAILQRLASFEKTLKHLRNMLSKSSSHNPELYDLLHKISERQRRWKHDKYGTPA